MKPLLASALAFVVSTSALAMEVEVSPALSFAGRPGNEHVGVLGQLGVAFHPGGTFVPEIIGLAGAWDGLEDASLGLEIGVRWQPLSRDALSPWLWLALAHGHDMSVHTLHHEPGGSIGGFAEGIQHRTGLAAGVGLTTPTPLPWNTRLLARLGVTSLWPVVDASRVTLSGTVGLAKSW